VIGGGGASAGVGVCDTIQDEVNEESRKVFAQRFPNSSPTNALTKTNLTHDYVRLCGVLLAIFGASKISKS